MSIDPMHDGAGYPDGESDRGSAEGAGVCSVCGRSLPAADLEAVVRALERRSVWTYGLLFWLPSVKARRQIWERGQALWTEQMTAVLSGPCDDCRSESGATSEWTPSPYDREPYGQHPPADPAPLAATTFLPADEAVPAAPDSHGQSHETQEAPAYSGGGDAMTAAIPAYSDYPAAPEPAADLQTAAMDT